MNNNKAYMDLGVKWGLIIGLVSCVIHFTLAYIDMRTALSVGTWIGLAISITLLVIQGLKARKITGNGLPYNSAFTTLFFAILVSSFLFILTSFVIKKCFPFNG